MSKPEMREPGHGTPSAYAIPSLKEARALLAFSKGEATAEQQKTVFNWLLRGPCRAGREVMVPGQTDTTAYLAGRLSVSLQIGWVLGQPVDAFRNGEQD
jgi:hypothetical protein